MTSYFFLEEIRTLEASRETLKTLERSLGSCEDTDRKLYLENYLLPAICSIIKDFEDIESHKSDKKNN